jgi:hypothetical protein
MVEAKKVKTPLRLRSDSKPERIAKTRALMVALSHTSRLIDVMIVACLCSLDAGPASAPSASVRSSVASGTLDFIHKPMAEWSVAEVGDWLCSIAPAYAQYCAAFAADGMNRRAVLALADEALREFGETRFVHRI